MVGSGIGTDTQCIIVNLTLSLQETQLSAQLGPSAGLQNSEQNDQLTTLELIRGFIVVFYTASLSSGKATPCHILTYTWISLDNLTRDLSWDIKV